MKQIIRLDMNGVPFEFEKADLDEKEISKIVHEINNVYYTKYKGKSFAIHRSLIIISMKNILTRRCFL